MLGEINDLNCRVINKDENGAIFSVQTEGVNVEILGFQKLGV